MEDIKALTECAECTWDYIDRMRMELDAARKERDELKKECALCSKKSASVIESLQKDLAAMRNELCFKCGNYREAHNGACDGCQWKKEA